jgi:hypothetical protein
MLFLVRLAFWLGVVVLLLPDDRPQRTAPAPQVGATKTVSAANGMDDATRRLSHDTLTPADLATPWRGLPARREAVNRVQR